MSKPTRTYEERINDLKTRQQGEIDKAKQTYSQIKQLEKRQMVEERKKRTNRLCQIGGTVEAVLGRAMTTEEIAKFMEFLKGQEERGHYLTSFLAGGKLKNSGGSNSDESV
mgnify:CR=1 FL=1